MTALLWWYHSKIEARARCLASLCMLCNVTPSNGCMLERMQTFEVGTGHCHFCCSSAKWGRMWQPIGPWYKPPKLVLVALPVSPLNWAAGEAASLWPPRPASWVQLSMARANYTALFATQLSGRRTEPWLVWGSWQHEAQCECIGCI